MTKQASPITGYEPRLASGQQSGNLWKISPRRLATMLNTLSPAAISLPAATEALHHEKFDVRRGAAVALSRRGDRDARRIMEAALREGEVQTRASVARHLHGFSWYSVEPLLRTALADADPRVREAAIYTLCDFADPQAYPLILEALHDGTNDDVRLAAAVGLRDRQDPDTVPVLAAVLPARDPEVRVKALEALGANHTPGAKTAVKQALHTDPHPDVRYNATLSLLELAEEKALPAIIQAVQEASGEMQAAILRGLFHASNYLMMDLSQIPAYADFIDMLRVAVHDPLAREAAIWPLAWLRNEAAVDLLRETYYETQHLPFKTHILRVAVGLMSECRDEFIADALQHPDATFRQAAEAIAARTGSGVQITFDHEAPAGEGFRNPVLGR